MGTTAGQQLRALFYVLSPGESAFRTLEEVPDYVEKSIPFFIAFIVLEFAVSWVQQHKLPGRINDGISSLSLGILSRLPDVLFRSVDLVSYVYVWNNYKLFELPWDSPWTWYLTFLGVDFAYYWFHRISHGPSVWLKQLLRSQKAKKKPQEVVLALPSKGHASNLWQNVSAECAEEDF